MEGLDSTFWECLLLGLLVYIIQMGMLHRRLLGLRLLRSRHEACMCEPLLSAVFAKMGGSPSAE